MTDLSEATTRSFGHISSLGCPGVVHNEHDGVDGCPKTSLGGSQGTTRMDFNVSDDTSLVHSARVLFNGTSDSGSIIVNLNGHEQTVPAATCCYQNTLNQYDLPANWLTTGANYLSFSVPQGGGAEISQYELEVVYNEHRVMVDPPPVHDMPMLSTSAMSFRFDHTNGQGMTYTGTTYLYNLGSTAQVPYTAAVISTETPWLTVSPGSGVATSPMLGGGVIPLSLHVDMTGIPVDADGQVGVVKITGGNMPVYVAVLAVNDGSNPAPTFLPAFTGLTTTFDKDAIPDYHGDNGSLCPRYSRAYHNHGGHVDTRSY